MAQGMIPERAVAKYDGKGNVNGQTYILYLWFAIANNLLFLKIGIL